MNTVYNPIYVRIVDLPLFNFGNPRQWFEKVERIFDYREIKGEMKRYYFTMHHLPIYLNDDEDLTKFLIPVCQAYTRLKAIILQEYEKSPTEYLLRTFPTSRVLTSVDTVREINALRFRLTGDANPPESHTILQDGDLSSRTSPSTYFIGPGRWNIFNYARWRSMLSWHIFVHISWLLLAFHFFYLYLSVAFLHKYIIVYIYLWPHEWLKNTRKIGVIGASQPYLECWIKYIRLDLHRLHHHLSPCRSHRTPRLVASTSWKMLKSEPSDYAPCKASLRWKFKVKHIKLQCLSIVEVGLWKFMGSVIRKMERYHDISLH